MSFTFTTQHVFLMNYFCAKIIYINESENLIVPVYLLLFVGKIKQI